MKTRCTYLLFLLLLITRLDAQVYGYDPIRYSNFETNPSFLASGKYGQMATYMHMGNIPFSGKFSGDALKYSVYSKKHFYGAGLVLNNTQINDSVSCRYAAIGAAYRNVLFDVIHTRIGFLYKFNSFQNPGGQFSEYTFHAITPDTKNIQGSQNLNASVSFASSRESIFASFAVLNLQLYGAPHDYLGVSPVYYVLSVGDLAKAFDAEHTNVSFTATCRRNSDEKAFSYFTHVRQDGININRRLMLVYGMTAGYCNLSFLQCKPSLSLYHVKRLGHRRSRVMEMGAITALYDFAIPLTKEPRPYKPCWQFSLTHFF